MEYKKGDPVWRKKVFDEKGYPMVFMQLMKPGYACNPQEFIEQKAFVSFYLIIFFLILAKAIFLDGRCDRKFRRTSKDQRWGNIDREDRR